VFQILAEFNCSGILDKEVEERAESAEKTPPHLEIHLWVLVDLADKQLVEASHPDHLVEMPEPLVEVHAAPVTVVQPDQLDPMVVPGKMAQMEMMDVVVQMVDQEKEANSALQLQPNVDAKLDLLVMLDLPAQKAQREKQEHRVLMEIVDRTQHSLVVLQQANLVRMASLAQRVHLEMME